MKCLNWKVIAALAAAAGALYLVTPGSFAAALPLLVVAACPLSMLVMMRAMRAGGGCHAPDGEVAALRAEVAGLRAQAGPTPATDDGPDGRERQR